MEQVSSTKKETSANWSLNSNTLIKEIFVMPRVSAIRSNPAYTGRSSEFARLMGGRK